MRIVAGQFRGRRLITPSHEGVRPTLDRIRQAIFTALESRDLVRGRVVCDAFCGTGALGLEALSRGAQRCIFVDRDPQSLNIARENARFLRCEDQCHFIQGEIESHIHALKDVNLWCLDPPYHQGLVEKVVTHIPPRDDVVVMAEMEKDTSISFDNIFFERVYGTTRIVMLYHRPNI